jgi:DNA topoisomerase-1
MEREREIRAFIPEDYFVITADVFTKNNDALTLTCTEEPHKKEEADRIMELGQKGPWIVKDVKEQEQKRSARPPFTTSTLQQAASTRLGFSPARTMMTAQRLYEAGHITYMRTDSTTLSAQAVESITAIVTKKFGKEYSDTKQFKTKSKNAQEAHEAIRPSHVEKESAGTTDDQKKLYKLIWTRAVASQMADAKVLKTKLTTEVHQGDVPDFVVNGSRVVFDGWLKADPAARGEDVELPKVETGEAMTLTEMHLEEKQTQPPNRYTEAGLVKELEKRGIGRPSTYAAIIKTIGDRGYVTKEGKTLFPTDTGDVVSSFLEQNFAQYISDDFTAEMEDELDDIASGTREYEKTLRDFYTDFLKDVKSKEKIAKLTNLGDAPKDMLCPVCGAPMVIKLSRGGKFMSCSRFPECVGARTIEGKVLEPNKPIGTHPESGEPIFVLDGRFGPYVQVGEKTKANPKPKRASIPKDRDMNTVTMADALKYLSLPRVLGTHPESGKEITANNGRFGPYIVHDGDFRSLKTDSVYEITLARALEILAEEKKTRRFTKKAPVK